MTTWPYHLILFVIISNDILLSLPIVFTYYLFLLDYISDILNSNVVAT